MIQLFPITTIDSVKTSAVKHWPQQNTSILFVLDDTEFTDPAESFTLTIQLSFAPVGSPIWPPDQRGYEFSATIAGGAKSKDGSPWSARLGPFVKDGVARIPQEARFRAEPVTGTPRVGLSADLE
jgi:hypothetical protein